MSIEVAKYSEINDDLTATLHNNGTEGVSQSFVPDANYKLTRAAFFINRKGSPTGTAVVKIYAATGTHGTSAKPTGSALATSDTLDPSVLSTDRKVVSFTFSGAEQITLTAGTTYCVALEYGDSGDFNNAIEAGSDYTGAIHEGNGASLTPTPLWHADAALDMCFYVYSDTDWTTESDVSTTWTDTELVEVAGEAVPVFPMIIGSSISSSYISTSWTDESAVSTPWTSE